MKQKFFIFVCFAVIFATFFSSSVYASVTPSGLPTVPSSDKPNAITIVYDTTDDMTKAVVFYNSNEEEFSIYVTQNSSAQVLARRLTETTVMRAMYKYTGEKWISDGTGVLGTTNTAFEHSFNSFIYSDIDIYNSNGDLVFQAPPAISALEMAITEGLTELQEETTQTMKIIALCGVGCLALLIGLVILPKVLRRSL